jgi:putative transcriptional regulator
VRAAKRAVDELADRGRTFVEAPAVKDYARLASTLRQQGAVVHRIERRSVDVKELRARMGVSQEEFAGCYCIDIATLRNWEQDRTKPEGPAAALLYLISRDPGHILRLFAVDTCGPTQLKEIEVSEKCPLSAREYGAANLKEYAASLSQRRSLFGFSPT